MVRAILERQLHVQDPVADVLVIDEVEDLGLINVAGVGPGVQDAIGVHREILAEARAMASSKHRRLAWVDRVA